MKNKNWIIIGLVVVIVALVVGLLFTNGILKLPAASKYKTDDEVSGATVGIGSGIENIGSTLEEIDNTLG